MIVTPARRIILAETQHGRIEILILGVIEAVGKTHAEVLAKLEAWPGFAHVAVIVMGSQAIGLRADVSKQAHHLDPISEFHRMRLDDRKFLEYVRFSGPVGEW